MTREKFEDICYNGYQLDWMISHGHSLNELFDTVVGLAEEDIEENPMDIGTDRNSVRALAECARERFFTERGLGSGSLYVCKEEFLGAEYLDEGYMQHLFSMMPSGKELMSLWRIYTDKDDADSVFISDAAASRKNAEYISAFLETEPESEEMSLHKDEMIAVTAVFKNGFRADIRCRGVRYRKGKSNLAWTEAVLFNEHGKEVSRTKPQGRFFGRWELYDGNDLYIVNAECDGEDPEMDSVMTIGTVHISSNTADGLDESGGFYNGIETPVYKNEECGLFIRVPSREHMAQNFFKDIPEDLAACMKLAQDHGCMWLCIDCDGPRVKSLRVYEW